MTDSSKIDPEVIEHFNRRLDELTKRRDYNEKILFLTNLSEVVSEVALSLDKKIKSLTMQRDCRHLRQYFKYVIGRSMPMIFCHDCDRTLQQEDGDIYTVSYNKILEEKKALEKLEADRKRREAEETELKEINKSGV